MDKRDLKVKYKCPNLWDDLTLTSDDKIRHCEECDKDVHFCNDPVELQEANEDDLCVAVNIHCDDEEHVMMGDIDWSSFNGEPPLPEKFPFTEEELAQLKSDKPVEGWDFPELNVPPPPKEK